MAATEDVNTALIAGLLGNAPGPEEAKLAKENTQGALSRVRGAIAAPMTPENYSPFQDMVASYLKNMVPGWNQQGLGKAVAAPFDRQMDEAKTRYEGGVKEAGLELGEAQKEEANITALRRSSIGAGATLARGKLTGQGSNAKVIEGKGPNGEPGHWMVDAHADMKDPDYITKYGKFFPGNDNEFTRLMTSLVPIYSDPNRQSKNPIGDAIDAASQILGTQRGPVNSSTGKPPYAVPLSPSPTSGRPSVAVGSSTALDQTGNLPQPPAPGDELESQYNGVGNSKFESGNFNIDPTQLPPEVEQTLHRILSRAEANPNNKELQKNTMEVVQRIASEYGMGKMPYDMSGPPSQAVAELYGTGTGEAKMQPAPTQILAGPPQAGLPLSSPRFKEPPTVDFHANELAKKSAETWAPMAIKERNELNKASQKSMEFDQSADLMSKLLTRPDVPEGVLGEVINNGRSALKSLGFPIDNGTQAAADMLNAMATKGALQQRTANGENLMPGNLVTYEEKMLRMMAPGLTISKGGSQALLDYIKAINVAHRRFAEEANKLADSSPHGILPMSWETRKNQLAEREMLRMKFAVKQIVKKYNLDIEP